MKPSQVLDAFFFVIVVVGSVAMLTCEAIQLAEAERLPAYPVRFSIN
jgi:hypothetical protein